MHTFRLITRWTRRILSTTAFPAVTDIGQGWHDDGFRPDDAGTSGLYEPDEVHDYDPVCGCESCTRETALAITSVFPADWDDMTTFERHNWLNSYLGNYPAGKAQVRRLLLRSAGLL
jgi:hypothetical protein